MILPDDTSARPPARFALFAQGLRPFFLAAALYAPMAVAAWVHLLHTGDWPAGLGDAVAWHAHEMLFGFTAAAIAGFMLTAVPNWTGAPAFAGPRLAGLAALWLAARLALNPVWPAPAIVAAIADLAFFPALAMMVLPPLLGSPNLHNRIFPVLLSVLTLANLTYHLDRMEVWPGAWALGKPLTLWVVALMVAAIGGRIIPSFTLNALRRIDPGATLAMNTRLDNAALVTLALLAVTDTVAPGHAVAGVLAAVAATLHGARLLRWRGLACRRQPILWVLHLGYAWLPLALALKALWDLTGWGGAQAWAHALTIGTFATMILAVMSRASLGHTGRALVAARPVVVAYVLVTIAVPVRLFGAMVVSPDLAYGVAGALWCAAFLLFSWTYAPILWRPRADGRPG